jgi:hypothetical protein
MVSGLDALFRFSNLCAVAIRSPRNLRELAEVRLTAEGKDLLRQSRLVLADTDAL